MPDAADIYATIQRFKSQLADNEAPAIERLVTAYAQIQDRAEAELLKITRMIEAATAAGEEYSVSWLYRQERWQQFITTLNSEIQQLNSLTGQQILGLSDAATTQGINNAMHILRIMGVYTSPPIKTVKSIVGQLADGSPLTELLDVLGQATSQAIQRALIVGIGAGQHPRVIARSIRQQTGMGLTRAITIARTESMRAYRTANIDTYKESEVITRYRWMATKSRRTCIACLGIDGEEFDLEVEPKNHVRCRCTVIPVTETVPRFQTGSEWFATQPASAQEAMLGKSAYSLYKDGKADLSDFVDIKHSEKWNDSIAIKSVKSLKAEKGISD